MEKTPTNKGPIELLCAELGAVFTFDMECTEVLTAFISELVNEIELEMCSAQAIEHLTDREVSGAAEEALERVKHLLLLEMDREYLIANAAEAHETVTVHDEGPCDHYIDMLSSCVSAIRFGLEQPCKSRHAAEAANHVWKHKYGVKLFDKHSNRFGKFWARTKFYEALGSACGE